MINLLFILLLIPFSSILSSNNDESLDAILHEHATRTMIHKHHKSDELYNATLPAYLSNIKVSVVALRSRTLWRKGANFSNFAIPPNTLPSPFVKRLLIVYDDLGNSSSSYYNLSGYTFLTPVVGFLVYDASSENTTKIELNTNDKPISIEFHDSLAWGANVMRKCVVFGENGEVFLSEMRLENMCYTRNQGHFSIVSPLKKKKVRLSNWIIVGLVGGIVGLMILVGIIMGIRSYFSLRNQEKESEDEGECLEACWIDSNKMPRAEVMRTHPVLEGTSLPN